MSMPKRPQQADKIAERAMKAGRSRDRKAAMDIARSYLTIIDRIKPLTDELERAVNAERTAGRVPTAEFVEAAGLGAIRQAMLEAGRTWILSSTLAVQSTRAEAVTDGKVTAAAKLKQLERQTGEVTKTVTLGKADVNATVQTLDSERPIQPLMARIVADSIARLETATLAAATAPLRARGGGNA